LAGLLALTLQLFSAVWYTSTGMSPGALPTLVMLP
jgi:hypothetical protein